MKKTISWIFILTLLSIAAGFFFFLQSLNNLENISYEPTDESAVISSEKLKKIEQLQHPGIPINAQTSNSGRENPFLPY